MRRGVGFAVCHRWVWRALARAFVRCANAPHGTKTAGEHGFVQCWSHAGKPLFEIDVADGDDYVMLNTSDGVSYDDDDDDDDTVTGLVFFTRRGADCLVTASQQGVAKVWDLRTRTCLHVSRFAPSCISIALATNELLAVAVYDSNWVCFVSLLDDYASVIPDTLVVQPHDLVFDAASQQARSAMVFYVIGAPSGHRALFQFTFGMQHRPTSHERFIPV